MAHLEPSTLQDVPAMDFVIERMEPSSGVGLGRPVERSLQALDILLLGGTSHEGTHQPFPVSKRTDEVAALPSPAVVLSARLDRYYDRLRRPPSSKPTSRFDRLWGSALQWHLFAGHRAGEGLSSSRRHLLNVPRPIRRRVLDGCASRVCTASVAFTPTSRARLSLSPTRRQGPNDAAGFTLCCGPLSCFPQWGIRRWASTRPVSRTSRQPATGPPGSYPDRTSTGRR